MEGTISNSKYMVAQLEIQPTTTEAGFNIAKKHGVVTILNPAPAKPLEALPPGLLQNTDYLGEGGRGPKDRRTEGRSEVTAAYRPPL